MQSGTTYRELYNGNIGMMATAIMDGDENPIPLSANHYSYDQLNRITGMTNFLSGANTGINYDYTEASTDTENTYGGSYTFDANGNLQTLQRRADDNSNGTLMDDFNYYYYTDDNSTTYDPTVSIPTNATNRLAYVADASPNASIWSTDLDGQNTGNYDYDDIGQLIKDDEAEIETIEWLVTNKVSKITRISSSVQPDLEFLYDGMGQRAVKIVKPRTGGTPSTEEGWSFTYYVRDASGNVLTTYTKKATTETTGYVERFAAKEHHLYGSKRLGLEQPNNPQGQLGTTYAAWSNSGSSGNATNEGYFDEDDLVVAGGLMPTLTTHDASTFAHELGLKSYECSNHLGNVLVVVSDKPMEIDLSSNGFIDGYDADVVSFSDYYPYGMLMPERNGPSTDPYRYGFQGQELDDEVKGAGNLVNYKYRMHDSRIGRFLSIDPLSSRYPSTSPYGFAENKVIHWVEVEGASGSPYMTWEMYSQVQKGISFLKMVQEINVKTENNSMYATQMNILLGFTQFFKGAYDATPMGIVTQIEGVYYTVKEDPKRAVIILNDIQNETKERIGLGMEGSFIHDMMGLQYKALSGDLESMGSLAAFLSLTASASVRGKSLPTLKVVAEEAQVTKNARKGDLWEAQVGEDLAAEGILDTQPEITLVTESGTKTRIDWMGTNTNGKTVLVEAKSSSTAPLTKNQKIAFPEIAKSGAKVVGKGKPPYTGGTKVEPTKVEIRRPDD